MPRHCKNSWLDSYLEYTFNQESPTIFHEWTALSILSATLGRNIWIPRVKYTIYPNLFVILVAGSAKCKKTTAIRIGEKIIKSIESPPVIFAQKITPEALIQTLEESKKTHSSSSGFICADELSVFMGADSVKSGIIPILTSLYDSPEEWVYRTRSRGKENVKNVILTVLAGSTKHWLKASVPESAIGGGFTSRIIFVFQERPSKPLLFHRETSREVELRRNIINDLSLIQKEVKGEITFSKEAIEVAEEWYLEEWNKTRDDKVDGYYARKHDIMFKIAALLSISERSDRIIDGKHISKALEILERNEKNLNLILETVASTATGNMTEKIYGIIYKGGEISHSELLRRCWRFATAQDVNLMMRALIESNEVIEKVSSGGRTYKVNARKKI